jgi:hypothetical protein
MFHKSGNICQISSCEPQRSSVSGCRKQSLFGPIGEALRYDLTGSTRHKYRFFYTFSAHSDSLTPWFLCKLTDSYDEKEVLPCAARSYLLCCP